MSSELEDWSSHYERGLRDLKTGDFESAIAELEDASRGDHGDYRVFNTLAAAYAALGRYEKAIGAFKIAERMAPDVARIHYNMAQAYEALGIVNEAQYEYQKALTVDPLYAKAKEALLALKARIGQA